MTPFPFSAMSYLLGATSLKVKDFLIGSCAVMMHIALFLYIGQSLDNFAGDDEDQQIKKHSKLQNILMIVEIFVALTIVYYVTTKAKEKLEEKVKVLSKERKS